MGGKWNTSVRLYFCVMNCGFLWGDWRSSSATGWLNGAINTGCLLNSKESGGGYSPARLQLLLSTLGIAIYYAYRCYQSKRFADVPAGLETALGGSNAFYVIRKFLSESTG